MMRIELNDFQKRYSIHELNTTGSYIHILFYSGYFGRYSILFRYSELFSTAPAGGDRVEKGPERGQEVSKLPLSESAKSTGGEYVANRPVLRYRMVIFTENCVQKYVSSTSETAISHFGNVYSSTSE